MNSFMKRTERVKAALEGYQPCEVTLLLADGSQRPAAFMEAVEIVQRGGVVDVLDTDATTRSLLLAMLGPWDFSDLEEMAEQ